MQFDYYKNWFENYVSNFTSNDKLYTKFINQKIHHTYRVIDFIEQIALNRNFSSEEIFLSRIIALFHDVGRFEQYDKYKTFNDRKSEDHALLGIKVLDKKKVLDKLDKTQKTIIIDSIRNHNKPNIENNLGTESEFYSKLIRDADKLDILNQVDDVLMGTNRINYGVVFSELEDTDVISSNVLNSFVKGEVIKYADGLTINDRKLLILGWAEDINFPESKKIAIEKQYFQNVYSTIPENEQVQKRYDEILASLIKESQIARVA